MFAFATSERFEKLPRKDRDRLEALSKLDEFSQGEEILVAGHPSVCIYLIASGGVDVRAKTRSGDVTVGQLGPGDLFGELEPFAQMPEGVRHVARARTVVRSIQKNPLRHELLVHRELATALLAVYSRSISEKLRAANEVAVRLAPRAGISRPPPPGAGSAPHLSAEEAAWLAVLGQELEVAPGETVVKEGETTRSFYVVQRGELEVRKQLGPGEDRALARLGPRDLFGFMAFVDGKPRSASVVSVSPSQLARVEADALDKALHVNFTVAFKFLGTLCGVLARTYRDTLLNVIAAA
ncbi:MAG TPA: cyclic nucleotide-binding domain-containing protein [Myxococcales bacterium]|nr:cyclic nucleotide-binding domain-containing protein [Myxococcales bacterium]